LKELQVVRDEVATRFREKYCEAAATIVGLFDQIAWVDEQIDSLNSRAHAAGTTQRMRSTEAQARGIDGFSATTNPISEIVRLPMFGLGSGEAMLAWPKSKPAWNLEYVQRVTGRRRWRHQSPRAARRRRSQRMQEFYRKQEEGREALNDAARQRVAEAARRREQGA
jgi:hypothetical protein